MWGTLEWADIGPDHLLVVCSKCVDANGRRQGVFVLDTAPDGTTIGRLLRRCSHSGSPPDFQTTTAHYLASVPKMSDDLMSFEVQTISTGDASWTLGRRADVLAIDPLL